MIAEILSVGTELLMGQIANTDAQYISRRLSELGVTLYRHTTVGDNPARVKQGALRGAVAFGHGHHHRRPWAHGGRSDQGDGGRVLRPAHGAGRKEP